MNSKLYMNANTLNPIFSVSGGIYRGSRLLFYGIAGGGKTTTALTLAMNELDKGNTVFYVDADFFGLHALKLQELYKAKYGIDFPVDKFKNTKEHYEMILSIWRVKGLYIEPCDSMTRIDLALPKAKMMKQKPSLIIIDSITQYYRIDIMKNSDFKPAALMMKIVNAYVNFAREHNITLVFTAQRVSEVKHTMKKGTNPNSEAYREFIGGEVLHHVMDNIVEFSISNNNKDRYADTKVKHRNSVQFERIKFTIAGGLVK